MASKPVHRRLRSPERHALRRPPLPQLTVGLLAAFGLLIGLAVLAAPDCDTDLVAYEMSLGLTLI